MNTNNFTDSELLQFLGTRSDLTPLESDLVARLTRALDEVDTLVVSPTQQELFECGGLGVMEDAT